MNEMDRFLEEYEEECANAHSAVERLQAELGSARIQIDALKAVNALNFRTADKLMRENAALLTEREHVRVALGGYTDSDLVSLATTLRARCDYLEKREDELEVVRNILRDAPAPDSLMSYSVWYDAMCDYLETV